MDIESLGEPSPEDMETQAEREQAYSNFRQACDSKFLENPAAIVLTGEKQQLSLKSREGNVIKMVRVREEGDDAKESSSQALTVRMSGEKGELNYTVREDGTVVKSVIRNSGEYWPSHLDYQDAATGYKDSATGYKDVATDYKDSQMRFEPSGLEHKQDEQRPISALEATTTTELISNATVIEGP